jgi:hypothetical protein
MCEASNHLSSRWRFFFFNLLILKNVKKKKESLLALHRSKTFVGLWGLSPKGAHRGYLTQFPSPNHRWAACQFDQVCQTKNLHF